jgi:hypothetical protein
LTAADVERMAAALGMSGTAKPLDSGWQLEADGRTLTVSAASNGWSISMSAGSAASTPGSTGSGGAATASPPSPDVAPPPVSEVPATEVPATDVPTTGNPETPPRPPVQLPSSAEAENIARETLTKMGLLEGDWKAEVVDSGMVSTSVACPPDAKCAPVVEPTITSRTVNFHQVIDGVPVTGLDASVEVGDRGAVSSIYANRSTIARFASYPLRPIEAAYADLVAGYAGIGPVPLRYAPGIAQPAPCPTPASPPATVLQPCSPGTPQPVKITVSGVELGSQIWYGRDGNVDVAYVVPTYRFHTSTGDVAATSTIDVVAVDPHYLAPAKESPIPVPQGAPAVAP